MSEAFQYVRELADRIGPRPATTDTEAEAADFISDVFSARGLEVERQDFECPRTYSWAYVSYHALTIASAGALYWQGAWAPVRWIALIVSAATAIALWMDLDTRGGITSLMPKGPSQNIIARHIPKVRRGEAVRRIVIVAHYDSARSSLAFAPSMVKNFAQTFGLMKWCTFLVPVLILADNLPVLRFADPYLWYATVALAAYLLVPLLINVHRELFMRFTDGANDNASGVAALLGIMEAVVPEPDSGVQMPTQPLRRIDAGAPAGPSTDGAPFAAPGQSRSSGALPDDFEWAETSSRTPGQARLRLDTVDFEPIRSADREDAGQWGEVRTDFDGDGIPDEDEYEPGRADYEALEEEPGFDADRFSPTLETPPERRGLFGLRRRKAAGKEKAPGAGFLGLGADFDVREEGKRIGNWENFEDDDDDFGTLGGWAGDDPIGDPEFAANEASRIRRRVTESIDRAITEKEIWFVATGAEEVGTCGMRAFIDQYHADLRGSLIINLDNLGTGTLYWVTREGMARTYASDRRLQSTVRKVSRDQEILIKGRAYKGLSTDATPALARGLRAMSIMAFDASGRLPNWHWATDTSENVQPENIDNAVRLVTGMVREF